MAEVYSIWKGPQYQGLTANDMMADALNQPMGFLDTLGDQTAGGVLDSPLLGTTLRNNMMAPLGPTDELRGVLQAGPDNKFTEDMLAIKPITEEEWKTSPYYRKEIPFDPRMTSDRAASLAEFYDAKKTREYFASKRPYTAFVGQLAGQAVDPINYIPVAGPLVRAAAVARLGRIGGIAASASLDAVSNTAFGQAVAYNDRRAFGDDVSWQATVSELAMASLIGAAFGGIEGGFDTFRLRKTAARDAEIRSQATERLFTIENTQNARIALNEAIDNLVRSEDVALSPSAVEGVQAISAKLDSPRDLTISEPMPDNIIPDMAAAKAAMKDIDTKFGAEQARYLGEGGDLLGLPNPRDAYKEAIAGLTEAEQSGWLAHGIGGTRGESVGEALAGMIAEKSPDFHSGSLLGDGGASGGGGSTKTDAKFILVNRDGDERGKWRYVIANTRNPELIEAARQALPGVNVVSPQEFADAVKGAGSRATQPTKLDPSAPRTETAPVEVKQAAARVAKPETVSELPKQYGVTIKPTKAVKTEEFKLLPNLEIVDKGDGLHKILRFKDVTDNEGADLVDGSLGTQGITFWQDQNGDINIGGTYLPSKYRAQGRGKAMYLALAEYASSIGKALYSDFDVSKDAMKMYDMLAAKGYTVQRSKDFREGSDAGYAGKFIGGTDKEGAKTDGFTLRVLPKKGEGFELDPSDGSFLEQSDIDQVRAEGRLTADDEADLKDAEMTFENSAAYGEALKAAVACII